MMTINNIRITRRELFAVLISGGIGAYLGSSLNVDNKHNDRVFLNIDLPEMNVDQEISQQASYAVFLALSQLVTAKTALDSTTAKQLYKIFIKEPWGKEHIASSYRQLLRLLENYSDSYSAIDALMHAKLGGGERWFLSHLLMTWYLGIYYHKSHETTRVTYDNALMFSAIDQGYPLPFKESLGFANWTQPLSDQG